MSNPFKAGDKVRLVSYGSWAPQMQYRGWKPGDLFEVVRVDEKYIYIPEPTGKGFNREGGWGHENFELAPPVETSFLPTEAAERKDIPLCRGLLDYFAAALAEVAHVSKVGNDQHNPGQEMHWAWAKSADHADCILRHLADRGRRDKDGLRHTAKVAWRALALLTEELVAEGAPLPRAAKVQS